ncbi:MAG: hypothetical protein H6732_06660 [Alphaproteobacteria bacterium]|nr:hypothetical protein [Alphaproteobacteria bacterium]
MRPILPFALLLAACAPEDGAGEPDDDGRFSVVVIPDTQVYAQHHPEVFARHLQWIVDHAEEHRIVFVSHVGDVVEHANNADHWQAAVQAFAPLRAADLPHGISVGAHDFAGAGPFDREVDSSCSPFDDGDGWPNVDCAFGEFLQHFGPATYADRPWYRGASPSGHSSYQVVEAGGMELLFLHLPQDPPEAEVVWGNEVLDAHPHTLAHLTTHRYLFDYRLTEALPPPLDLFVAGRFNAATYAIGGQVPMFHDSVEADDLFTRLVAPHPNVWSVHCGHVDAEFRQEAVNERGLPVQEILVDFQDMADGGGGFLRLLTYLPEEDRVEVYTVSTETGELRENGDGFEHSIDILAAYREQAASLLETFGIDEAEADQLFADVRGPTELRQQYYDSLYGEGARDSRFALDVDFDAYLGR